MARNPYQYELLLVAAARAKRIRWGVTEGDRRAVKRTVTGAGVSGTDLLIALLDEAGGFVGYEALKARWIAIGCAQAAFRGTLLALKRTGCVDVQGVDLESGALAGGRYRLREGVIENRKARSAKGAKRAFELIYALD